MIHLLLLILIFCGALGATLSKTSNNTTIRQGRQHQGTLQLDKPVI
jgi:hypothetical protein